MDSELLIGLVSVSDRASKGVYRDEGIPALKDWLNAAIATPAWRDETRLIADEQATIEATLKELVDERGCHLVLTTGGTGPAKRDVTPEATLAVADKVMPGFGEQMRQISLQFVPTAILSRQVAVIRGQSADHQSARAAQIDQGNARRPQGTLGQAAGARHLRRRALLHRPDRRALRRDARRGGQGIPAQVGAAAQRRRRVSDSCDC